MIYSTSFLATKSIRLVQKWIVFFALLNLIIWYWNIYLNVIMPYIILMHIPHFMFFPNDLLLFILDYRNDVGQKANLSIFFNLDLKWVVK